MMDRFLDSNKPESADKEPQPVAWLWQNERVERTKTAKKNVFQDGISTKQYFVNILQSSLYNREM